MADRFTETSTQGSGSRIANSLVGLVVGPLLVIGAIVLLWWNEGRAVHAITGLKDAASQVVEAEASGPSPVNDGKLVHVVGTATAQAPIQDADVGIGFADQVGVARTAEMYQWKETKTERTQDNVGGSSTTTTTYDYTREWSEDALDSAAFKYPDGHQNPAMPFRSKRFAASDAKLGGWTLGADVLDRIDYTQALTPDAPSGWTLSGENYYRGDPAAPKVGDMRVRYVGLPSGATISVLAKQSGNGFAAFTTKNGYQVELAAVGDHSAAALIENQRKAEALLTWVLRGVGMLLMFVGIAVFLAPLSTIASVIPLFGRIVGGAAALVALVIAIPLSILVIAFAWLTYRPLIGGSLMLLALAVGYALWRWRKTRAAAEPAPVSAKAS
jgi:hypothetical protein